MKKISLIVLTLLILSGCTNAGPFITSISADGNGGVIIDKCLILHNGWTGTVSNANCTTSQIKLK